ncbi:MAG: Photosystem II manganese-stabilizing polypeptide, partial [Aphanizomenon sp.]
MRYRPLIVAFLAIFLVLITACSDSTSTSLSDVL